MSAVSISSCRVVYNGDWIVDFDDGWRFTLPPSCIEYTAVDPNARDHPVKHYTPFTPTKHIKYVIEALQWFNTYCTDRPRLIPRMIQKLHFVELSTVCLDGDGDGDGGDAQDEMEMVQQVEWPLPSDIDKYAEIQADKSLRLRAMSENVVITLYPSCQTFCVQYICIIPGNSNGFWATQMYSVRWFPKRWRYPLCLARALYKSTTLVDTHGEDAVPRVASGFNELFDNEMKDIDTNNAFTDGDGDGDVHLPIPIMISGDQDFLAQFPQWDIDTSVPLTVMAPVYDWSKNETYRFLPRTDNSMVEVVRSDGTTLLGSYGGDDDRFIYLYPSEYRASSPSPSVISMRLCPPRLWTGGAAEWLSRQDVAKSYDKMELMHRHASAACAKHADVTTRVADDGKHTLESNNKPQFDVKSFLAEMKEKSETKQPSEIKQTGEPKQPSEIRQTNEKTSVESMEIQQDDQAAVVERREEKPIKQNIITDVKPLTVDNQQKTLPSNDSASRSPENVLEQSSPSPENVLDRNSACIADITALLARMGRQTQT